MEVIVDRAGAGGGAAPRYRRPGAMPAFLAPQLPAAPPYRGPSCPDCGAGLGDLPGCTACAMERVRAGMPAGEVGTEGLESLPTELRRALAGRSRAAAEAERAAEAALPPAERAALEARMELIRHYPARGASA